MPTPQVSWFKTDNVTPLPKWEIGTIDAGSSFAISRCHDLEQPGGTGDLSTMTNCTITTKDGR